MQPDDYALLDIANEAQLIAEFVAGFDAGSFAADIRTQRAVLHSLMIIGEAVKRLTHDFRSEHPAIAWNEIAGMRDVFVHAYHRVEIRQVWIIAVRDVPALRAYIADFIPQAPDSS